tara:strand:+ start:749 stop:2080 length:1332 start_codon:yes stop_codon:yes gene_type:complete
LILQKLLENRLKVFFPFQRNSRPYFIFYFLFLFLIFDTSKAGTKFPQAKNNQIEIEYLESRNELEDYIIDTGDAISLEFFPAKELNGVFSVNEEGELLLPKINETFVRGLTKSELQTLLETRYAEFLIDPVINIRFAVFKSIRVLVSGELRNPGFYKFPAYKSGSFFNPDIGKYLNSNEPFNQTTSSQIQNEDLELSQILKSNKQSLGSLVNKRSTENNQSLSNKQSLGKIVVKRSSQNIITISDVIRKAGGITSKTDLSRIEIIRDVPLGKGGGKKRTSIDFNSFINKADFSNDIRIFDGDTLFFPKLSKANPNQIPNSVLSGISPKFISVNLYGRVETPGIVMLPLEAALSDAIDLTGPLKPLSGKIVLIRYEPDGKLIKKNVSYSSRAKRGSKRNPFLRDDDLISVRNSFFGKTTDFLGEFTAPFIGVYTTKELIEDFSK